MNLRCKPGDLARVINDGTNFTLPLINRIVLVKEFYVGQPYAHHPDSYPVNPEGSPAWICHSPGTLLPCTLSDGVTVWQRERVIDDSILRPIRGNEEPTEETKELELEL